MRNIFCVIVVCLLSLTHALHAGIERRAALDIGSGGTKVVIADVDSDTHQVVDVIHETSFSVPYQAALDRSEDGTFDAQTRAKGIQTFQDVAELANRYNVEKVAAIATSAFRKANNGKEFITEIERQTAIKVQIISQREEGELAFFSVLATGNYSSEDVVVWDIGTGSLQMTTMNAEGGLSVYMGEQMGSVAFKTYIIDTIQENDLQEVASPNPMTEDDIKQADRYARAFGRKAYPILKQKILNQVPVIGIGRLFYHSIRPLAAEDTVINRSGLRHYIESALNRTDEELNNPFAHVDVSNCILTLAIMKALHIQEITPVETTTSRGLLIAPSYWKAS